MTGEHKNNGDKPIPRRDKDEVLGSLLGRVVLVTLDAPLEQARRYVAAPLRQIERDGSKHPAFWYAGSPTGRAFLPFESVDVASIKPVQGNLDAIIRLWRVAREV